MSGTECSIQILFTLHCWHFAFNFSLTVTSQDVTAGHRWKTFILPLDEKFHEGSFQSYLESRGGLDCLTKSCDGETLKRGGRAYTDYHAEIIIFRQLLGSLHFVKDLADADMVLVPVLGVSTISVPHSCRSYGKCLPTIWASFTADTNTSFDSRQM